MRQHARLLSRSGLRRQRSRRSHQGLGKLKPAFKPDGTTHAGRQSPLRCTRLGQELIPKRTCVGRRVRLDISSVQLCCSHNYLSQVRSFIVSALHSTNYSETSQPLGRTTSVPHARTVTLRQSRCVDACCAPTRTSTHNYISKLLMFQHGALHDCSTYGTCVETLL